MRRGLNGALICALLLLGCTVTRRNPARDRGVGDAIRDLLGERTPTDAVHEPILTDAVHELGAGDALRERGPTDLGLFSCKASLGSVSVQGLLQGKPLSATRALAARLSAPQTAAAVILLTSQGSTCAAVHAADLVLTIGICAPAAGSYAVGQLCGDGSKVFARLATGLAAKDDAVLGTIIVEAFDSTCGGKSKGSFVLSFPDQGGPALLTGSFDTVGCGALALP
jgi:hypothetical protein